MAGALVALAAGSVLTGWVNVPEALPILPEFTWLHHFLHPSFAAAEDIIIANLGEPSHFAPFGGGEGTWAVISTLLAIVVVAGVYVTLRGKKYLAARESAEPSGIWGPLYRKWYVDELYDLIIIRPFQAICRFSWRIFDQGLIDGVMINGVAYATRFGGWVISRFQTGYVGTYVLIIVVGVLIILGAVAL
jgi:NADH-quinone oxidoreductase subunit L